MKLTKIQIERLVRKIFDELAANKIVTYKSPEEKVILRAIEYISADYDKERELERDARKMLEDIERQHTTGELDRHKMLQMIKRKLAEERKIIL